MGSRSRWRPLTPSLVSVVHRTPTSSLDRLIRPGDQAYFDIIHAFNGYRTCYYRTFAVGRATNAHRDAYKKARELIDSAIAMVKPGVTTDQIAALWPTAQEFGFSSEMEAFGLQFGHGLGLGLHERPVISRLNSLENPVEIEPGMVFALETYWPASDGHLLHASKKSWSSPRQVRNCSRSSPPRNSSLRTRTKDFWMAHEFLSFAECDREGTAQRLPVSRRSIASIRSRCSAFTICARPEPVSDMKARR